MKGPVNMGENLSDMPILPKYHQQRQTRITDLNDFERVLDLTAPASASLPCHSLPVAQNQRFFGRDDELRQIEGKLHPSDRSRGLRSLALFGLGGVGKTQTALAYAYGHIRDVDAILWVPAETKLAVQQGFTDIAVNTLRLPQAQPHAHQQNIILVMSWLRQTSASWLLVFDNVESHDIFDDCWPVSDHGAILITTRRRVVASQPVESGLEVNELNQVDGAQFLLHMLPNRQHDPAERQAACKLVQKLHGHALAISQMAAYINARQMLIEDFLQLYDVYPRQLHRERKAGWKYLGYNHALDTVWNMSFEALSSSASAYLGVMSFLVPESIPTQLLDPTTMDQLLGDLTLCEDVLGRWNAIEQLTDHALIKRDPVHKTITLHRLVQAECLLRMTEVERQSSFDRAVKLLLAVFPKRQALAIRDSDREDGDKYLQQIATILHAWNDSQSKEEPLKSTLDFCNLLANCAWLVHDNDTVSIASLATNSLSTAFGHLPTSVQSSNSLLKADMHTLLSVSLSTAGDFLPAKTHLFSALQILRDLNMPEDLRLSECYNTLGVTCDSAWEHSEAAGWHDKTEAILKKEDNEGKADRDTLDRLKVQNHLNTARNWYFMGHLGDAEESLNKALAIAERIGSWYLLAYVHQTFSSLYTRISSLDQASSHIKKAIEILSTSGCYASSSWIRQLCGIRAAIIFSLQSEDETDTGQSTTTATATATPAKKKKEELTKQAISEAEKAVAIGKLYSMPASKKARATHVLARALALDPDRKFEMEEMEKEARTLKNAVPGQGKGREESDQSDDAFDGLVRASDR